MFSVEPFTIHDIAVCEHVKELRHVSIRPRLEKIELCLSGATIEKMPTTLEQKLTGFIKTDRTIGPIHLFFDHQIPVFQLAQRSYRHILVSTLNTGTDQMGGAWIFIDIHDV